MRLTHTGLDLVLGNLKLSTKLGNYNDYYYEFQQYNVKDCRFYEVRINGEWLITISVNVYGVITVTKDEVEDEILINVNLQGTTRPTELNDVIVKEAFFEIEPVFDNDYLKRQAERGLSNLKIAGRANINHLQ